MHRVAGWFWFFSGYEFRELDFKGANLEAESAAWEPRPCLELDHVLNSGTSVDEVARISLMTRSLRSSQDILNDTVMDPAHVFNASTVWTRLP